MKHSFFVSFLLLFFLVSCDDDDENLITQEAEQQQLDVMLAEIQTLAGSVSCENASEWTFISYGSKACGGPIGYIAYSTTIDTVDFLNKVEVHRQAEDEFNKKWGVASDCSLALEPTGVICENGSPKFIYE